jgi:simple sugar transport system substrate-binding protein
MSRKIAFFVALTALLVLTTVLPAAAQDDEFVFGVILVGPSNDRGWSQAHYEGALYAEEQNAGSRMLLFESLNPADSPEATLMSVVTEMVAEGAELIITTSAEFGADTEVVAEAFPDVKFVNMTGSNVLNGAPENMSNHDAQLEWMDLVTGCAAALTTNTGNIGYLGPLIDPETRRLASSAYLGAKHCWETYKGGDAADLSFTVTWIGFWFNIPGVTLDPTEETNSFFDNGADVVISAIDTPEALTVTAERSSGGEELYVTGYDYHSACDVAPEQCIGVPYYNWGPYYARLVGSTAAGEWEQSWTWEPPSWADINDLDVSSAGFLQGPALSEENAANLDAFIAELAAFGTDEANAEKIMLWEGPLNYADGTEFLAEGVFAEPLEIWYLPQLLEGMTGASE